MKALINHLLKPFNIELHGKSYIKKLKNSDASKDAFLTQQRLVKNAKCIFDVGANRGDVTGKYASLYPEAAIYAFEPFENFQTKFQATHGNNHRIHWINTALSDSATKTAFYVNRSADTNSLYKPVQIGASSDKSCYNLSKSEVLTNTVDQFCRSHGISVIDILKIDTQGSELAIFKGAKKLLTEQKIALIYTEAYFQPQYQNQPLFYDIANFLEEHGYFLEDIYEPYYNERFLLWCDAIFVPK